MNRKLFLAASLMVSLLGCKQSQLPAGDAAPKGYYTLYGEIGRQGRYEMDASRGEVPTVSQAIVRAGGFSRTARQEKVKLIRKTPEGNRTILVNVHAILEQDLHGKDIRLRSGDVIVVDEMLRDL